MSFCLQKNLRTDGVLYQQYSKDIDVSSVELIRRHWDDGAARDI